MSISRPVTIAAVGGVVALATGIGASQALAAGSTPSPSASSSAAPQQSGEPGQGARPAGPGRGGHGPGLDAAKLATALGLSEAKVQTALQGVREQLKPATPPAQGARPTEAERAARERERVAALAKALGVSQAKVQAAVDQLQAAEQSQRRTDLSTRLDAAVKADTLTAADKASVLKAFDAGVLGGGPR